MSCIMSAGIFGKGSYYLIGCVFYAETWTHPCGTRRTRKSCGCAKLDEPTWVGWVNGRLWDRRTGDVTAMEACLRILVDMGVLKTRYA